MYDRKVDITMNTKGHSILNLLVDHSIQATLLHKERVTGVKLNPLGNLISFPIQEGTEISISTFSQGDFLVTGTAREFADSYFLYYVMNKPNLGLNVVWNILSDETKKELYSLREDQKLFFQMSFLRKTNSYKVLNFGLLKDFTEAATYSFKKRMVKPNLARKFFNLTGGFVEKEQPLGLNALLSYLTASQPKVTMVCTLSNNFKAPTIEQAIKRNLAMIEDFKIKEGSHPSNRHISPDLSNFFKPQPDATMSQQQEVIKPAEMNNVRKGYQGLATVLERSLNQAQNGKGNERHQVGETSFEQQPICELARLYGTGYNFGQAAKKAHETSQLSTKEAKVNELLGAINYLAAAVLVIEEGK